MNNITYLRHSTIDQGLQYLSLQIQGTIEIVILILFLNVYLCILILSEQKLDRYYHCRSQPQAMHKVAIAGRINATFCSHQLLVISFSKYSYDVKIQF